MLDMWKEFLLARLESPYIAAGICPYFVYINPRKAKIRLVYDASAKYGSMSLNEALYQGHDLTNHLRGVLLRFREKPIAIGADIESMFSNFLVPAHQKDMLRFFWFDHNDYSRIMEYRICVHVFGATSSPSIATFALQQITLGNPHLSTNAKGCIMHNFYVDGVLKSVCKEEEAVVLIEELKDITLKG